MDAQETRRRADVEGLHSLRRGLPELLEIEGQSGRPVSRMDLVFRIPTAVDRGFPERRCDACRVRLAIPVRYPYEPAQIHVFDPVYNPHVFASGLLCTGWMHEANWTLAELTLRAMRILALDPAIISTAHPANRDAAVWYKSVRRRGLFPTVDIPSSAVLFRNRIPFRKIA